LNYRWSIGVIVGLPIAALLTIGLLIVGVLLVRWARRNPDNYDAGPGFWLGVSSLFGAVVVVALTAWFMWPYSGEYHQWRAETGTVTQVDSRLIGQDKSTTERFVVTLDGNRQRSCDDTRCAQVEVGDVLTLTCKRAWQYTGTHGYDCNFVSVKRGGQ
jgi:hypothetical protein